MVIKKYKWNYKKFIKNIIKLIGILAISFMFTCVILGIAGIDIVF